MRNLSRGDRGKEVLDVQTRLRGRGFELGREGVDGFFGPSTELAVRSFQQERGLVVDGVVGANSWRELVEAGYELGDRLLYLREPPFRGDDVLALQVKLNLLGFNAGAERGVHDAEVERAVIDFQRNAGLPLDGIVGESTLVKLEAVRKAGFEGFFFATPHSIGLEHSDHKIPIGPTLPGGNGEFIFEENMIFSLDMPYYEIGWGNLHVEDQILVTADGVDALTNCDVSLRVI